MHVTYGRLHRLALAALFTSLIASPLHAQKEAESEAEKQARLARRGAGITVGIWQVRGLTEQDNVDYSESLSFEGFFAKGLDKHLALENTIGFWMRSQEVPPSGGIGGTSGETIKSYIIPQFTSIKFYPTAEPMDRFQPFLGAGAGFAIAIDDRETEGGGLLGGFGGTGTAFVPGFGLKGQVGTEIRGKALGLSVAGKYQWIRFFDEVGGERTFRGFGADLGFVYRFQY